MTTARRRDGTLLAVLLVAPFLAQADATIANVATPAIQDDLQASGATAELVIGGYMIAFAVLLITGARLGQLHGYKRVFLLGLGGFAVTSLLGGLAPNAPTLVVMRVLQGASAAVMFPQALTGIQLNFSGGRRLRAIGSYAIALSMGAVTGQICGGLLVAADIAGAGWRTIFLVNVPLCVVVAAAAVRVLPPDSERDGRRVHLAGVATLSAAVLLVVLPLTLGRAEGWPAWTWLCLAASPPACALFVLAQRRAAARGRDPLVNLALLVRPPVFLGLLTLLIATSTYYALLFTLAQYMQHGLERGSIVSGLVLVPWVAAFGVAGQVTRWLPPRLGPGVPAAGCLVLAAAYLTIGGGLSAGIRADALLVPLLAVGGFGLGTQFSTLIGRLTNAVPARYAPDISGTITTVLQVGGALGVAGFGAVYLSLAGSAEAARSAQATTHAFAGTTLAMGCAALVAAGAAWFAARTRPPAPADLSDRERADRADRAEPVGPRRHP
ncbi:MAG TPA: MFS transporter [Streptosporangiaceae bacterium]|nr:MFS transporter [Streptosporangiaceae bacterium]